MQYITNTDTKMVLQTNKNAPNYRIIVIDLENPGEKNWTTLVPVNANWEQKERDILIVVFSKIFRNIQMMFWIGRNVSTKIN